MNRRLAKQILNTTAAWALLSATTALAFPNWIGVYGDYERHDGGNPGTFTVLMNQDYVGLEAEVGFQVDGGAWQILPMDYAGNIDGNSMWSVTPADAFPAGANVTFYFHGWDLWGGDIWDSNGGNNYSFEVAGSSASLVWGDLEALDPGFQGGVADACVSGDAAIVVASGLSGGLSIARRDLSTGSWGSWQTLAAGVSFQSVAVGGSGSDIVVVGGTQTDLKVYRSADGGTTFDPTPAVIAAPAGMAVTQLDVAVDPVGEVDVALRVGYSVGSQIWYLHSGDRGQTWDPAVLVRSSFWVSNPRVGRNGSGIFVAYTVAEGQRVDALEVSISIDGLDWANKQQLESVLGGTSVGKPALIVDSSSARVALDRLQGSTRIWAYTGSDWQETASFTAGFLNAGLNFTYVAFQAGPRATLYTRYDGTPNAHLSNAAGTQWSSAQTVSHAEVNRRVVACTSGNTVYLLWYGETYAWQEGTLQTDLPGLEGIGNVYHWPFNGDIDAGEDLFVNIDSWPMDAAASARVVYSADSGATWFSVDMLEGTPVGENDHWYVNLGTFAPGTGVGYAIEVAGAQGEILWDTNGGSDYFATFNAGNPVQWIGNSYHWPFDGDIEASDPVWVNIESWPQGAAVSARVVYTVDGSTWQTAEMASEPFGNNDHWYVDLGVFTSGSHVQYAIEVIGGAADSHWDNNGGGDFHFDVN